MDAILADESNPTKQHGQQQQEDIDTEGDRIVEIINPEEAPIDELLLSINGSICDGEYSSSIEEILFLLHDNLLNVGLCTRVGCSISLCDVPNDEFCCNLILFLL